MKNLFYGILSVGVLIVLGAVVYQRLQPAMTSALDATPAPAAAPAPLSDAFENAMAEQMPPARNGGRYPAVNRQRLQTLAGSDYEGPSYTADYSRYEMIAAQKRGFHDRAPASNETKAKKATKTK